MKNAIEPPEEPEQPKRSMKKLFAIVAVSLAVVGAGCAGWFSSDYLHSKRAEQASAAHKKATDKLQEQLQEERGKLVAAEARIKSSSEQTTPAPVSTAPTKAIIPPVKNGIAPLISRIETNEPVVFLTIDDGAHKDPSVVAAMKKHKVKASLFLSDMFIASNPGFFKQIKPQNVPVQNHTIAHDTKMSGKSLAYQQSEICEMSGKLQSYYGQKPYLFRPPGGSYTSTTLQAAAACGIRAVVNWSAKANGGSMQYQVGDKLRPGDIVLMHFRPEFVQDLEAFVKATKDAGLRMEQLEDWITPAS